MGKNARITYARACGLLRIKYPQTRVCGRSRGGPLRNSEEGASVLISDRFLTQSSLNPSIGMCILRHKVNIMQSALFSPYGTHASTVPFGWVFSILPPIPARVSELTGEQGVFPCSIATRYWATRSEVNSFLYKDHQRPLDVLNIIS